MNKRIIYQPVSGKTYSLFGNAADTDGYYQLISHLTDALIKENPDLRNILNDIQKLSKNKRKLKQGYYSGKVSSVQYDLIDILKQNLSDYTKNVHDHLGSLSIIRKWDKVIGLTEPQYHLYMLEIELMNRINKTEFNHAGCRIALLPHCLRDLTKDCRSEKGKIDYVCKSCSKDCFIRQVSETLRKYNVDPYIWMSADLKKLIKQLKSQYDTIGVFGIACIPELVNGMRRCMKEGIPVIGLQLNANRCARWMGKFHSNSVNLEQLEKLLE